MTYESHTRFDRKKPIVVAATAVAIYLLNTYNIIEENKIT